MEDYDAILKEARRLRFGEDRAGYILNRISDLPEAKSRMKQALKNRIRELVGAYIALASFVSDEDADYMAGMYGDIGKNRVEEIFTKVNAEIDTLEREMREFDPFELPTARESDA